MIMFKDDMLDATALQLSCDYGCDRKAFFHSDNITSVSTILAGRRCFKADKDFFKVATMGNCAVASVDKKMYAFTKNLLLHSEGIQVFDGKTISYINKELEKYNHTIGIISQFYLPSMTYTNIRTGTNGFNLKVFEEDEIKSELYLHKGFCNAIMYEDKGDRKDVLAVCAMNNNTIMGMAGASCDSKRFWQIGIDVLPQYRNKGLATELVLELTKQVFMHGAIPYYGTWPGNIASHNVARKCGYFPAWTEMFAIEIEKQN